MTTTVLLMTDSRRDYLVRTIASFEANVTGTIDRKVIHDDSGDPDYRHWLANTYPAWQLVTTAGRSGFGGAIASAWRHLAAGPRSDFVFHLEDDFTFDRPVDLDRMAMVLDLAPYLAQMALRRQAWNAAEIEAGGVVEVDPDAFLEVTDGFGATWLEHRCFWTTNPCLYRASLLDLGWPDQLGSEAAYGRRLLAHGFDGVAAPDVRFGYWGSANEPPAVTHIGFQRAGTGYW